MNEIEWELHYRQKKIDKTLLRIQGSLSKGYASETAVGQTIINQNLRYISEELEDLSLKKTRGTGGKYAQVFRDAIEVTNSFGILFKDYDRAAYIGLMTILDGVFHQRRTKNHVKTIVARIGERLEQEQQLNIFNRDLANYSFVQLHELSKKNYKDTKRLLIQRVQKKWAEDHNAWEPWGNRIRVQIGMRVLRAVLRVMDDYLELKQIENNNRKEFCVLPKQELNEFMEDHTNFLLNRMTSTQPCIEEPIEWERQEDGTITGGFHSISVYHNIPFIRCKTKAQRDYCNLHNPSNHVLAVNALQRVQWSINKDVLEFIKDSITLGDFPEVLPSLHNKELTIRPVDEEVDARKAWGREAQAIIKWNKANTTKILLLQNVISLATELEDKPFWFVYNCDFRGRIIACSSYLNPQGTDYVRALLRFSKGKVLGKSGYKWLAVHGANCYGYNQISYYDRYQWVMDNMDGIRATALEPHSNAGRRLLREAKDPFQFFAFCREWTELSKCSVPTAFISHLPVTLDGSCNGFQHISALLRDEQGSRRVNLTHEDLPQDLYIDIANELTRRITKSDDNDLGKMLLKGGIDKEIVKPVVLAIPYGLTIRGASLAIEEYLNKNSARYGLKSDDLKNWDLIRYIAKVIVDISEEYVQSSKELKAWLRQCSDLLAAQDSNVKWISPVGFPVFQPYTLFKEDSIKTEFFGTKTIYYRDEPHGIAREKSRVSLTPNLIHSLDSSHLVLLLNGANNIGIDTLTCVHDSVGTYAADIHDLRTIINGTFCELYTPDVLANIRDQWEEITPLPPLPEYGTYDINEVLKSLYFFK